jgi:REP element-mobilizing transposase RayT
MSTYTQIIYQIVFSTKFRSRILSKENRIELFQFISGILLNKKCHLYQINGVEDHLHILTHVHPTVALSSLVKDVKVASSLYIKENRLFDGFTSWQEGYGAFTYNIKQKHRLIEYVKNQEEHHKKRTYKEEYKALLIENGIEFDEKYFL